MNEEVGNAILETISDRSEKQLDETTSRYFAVSLGLLFLG